MSAALLLIDYINEIVHEDGKLAQKGYSEFIKKNNVFENLSSVIQKAREKKMLIIHVKLSFSPDYKEQPKNSLLFGKVHEFGVLKLGTWSTEFHEKIDVEDVDAVIVKHRVSAFYSTQLESILKANEINSIFVAGVATDLAVTTTAREAHDRDYHVTVISDCCAAATEEEHKNSLSLLSKIATIGVSHTVFT